MVYFLLYVLIETLFTTNIASRIGGLNTFFEIVISAMIGLFLLTNFRYTLANNAMALFSREIDADEFMKSNIYSFVGAILLIVPGMFSDLLGVLLQFSSVGNFFARKIFKTKRDIRKQKGDFDDEIIDVEVIDGELTSK